MAIILSSSQNIEFLLFLVKLAIAIGLITILLLLIFGFRLKNIEKRMYLTKKPLKKRLNPPKFKTRPLVTTKIRQPHQTSNLVKRSKRHGYARFFWLFAIAIASITGIAIAFIQLGNGWISPEISTFIWFLIGVMLIVTASFIKA